MVLDLFWVLVLWIYIYIYIHIYFFALLAIRGLYAA